MDLATRLSKVEMAKNGVWHALVQYDVATPANSKVVDSDSMLTEPEFVAAVTALRCDGYAIELCLDPLGANVKSEQAWLFEQARKTAVDQNGVAAYIERHGCIDFGFGSERFN